MVYKGPQFNLSVLMTRSTYIQYKPARISLSFQEMADISDAWGTNDSFKLLSARLVPGLVLGPRIAGVNKPGSVQAHKARLLLGHAGH